MCYPPLVFAKFQSVLPARLTRQAASLRNLCVLRVCALDFSSLGLILNLQLSTSNRVSFPASHLSLSKRSSKSFTIRTSETPFPQLLYNPHLQAPLGSAGNKGLITPLESALTGNSPVTPLESALTKSGGRGWEGLLVIERSGVQTHFDLSPFSQGQRAAKEHAGSPYERLSI